MIDMIVHHRNNRALYAFKLNIKLQFTCLTLSDPYSDKQSRVRAAYNNLKMIMMHVLDERG